jgi:hypothetical protein
MSVHQPLFGERVERIGVVGSRDFPNIAMVYTVVSCILSARRLTIVSGGARGVDRWAENASRAFGRDPEVYPILDSDPHPNVRNGRVVNRVQLLVAFQWQGSTGTQNAIELAHKRGIPYLVFGPDNDVREVIAEIIRTVDRLNESDVLGTMAAG